MRPQPHPILLDVDMYLEGGYDSTYVPLRECTHAYCDECPFAIPWCLYQCRPAHFGRHALHFNCSGNFSHFKLDKWVGSIIACVVMGE